MNTQQHGSFEPDEHAQGGFFDDVNATIVSAEVVEFDYKGQADPVCALAVTFRQDGNDDPEEDRTEYYRIGALTDFTPSADRQHYVPVGEKRAMNKQGKGSLFLQALKKAGYEMGKLAGGISVLAGLHVHLNSVPMPEIKDAKKKDNTVLIVTKILGQSDAAAAPAAAKPAAAKKTVTKAAAAKPAAAPAAATEAAAPAAAAAPPPADAEADEKAQEVILALLMEKGGKMNKSAIPPALFKAIPADQAALRNKCIALGSNAAWLGAADVRPWQYEGGELSLG
jgi:pyruvate/2-oxoglutarate dehydrogenase complex dihydrolipoamide acyltransferase (E2) component